MFVRLTLTLFSIFSVSGCVSTPVTPYEKFVDGQPQEMFYQDGGSFDGIERALVSCKIEAERKVPVLAATGVTPTYTTPLQTSCNSTNYGNLSTYGYGGSYRGGSNTTCTQTGGQTYGGGTYNYDANSGLRRESVLNCMANRGIRLARIPACPKGTDLSSQDSETVFRPLSTRTCYTISGENGVFRVGEQ